MKTGERKTVRRRLIHSYLSSMISITLVLIVAGVTGLLAVNAGAVTDYFKENIKLSVIFDDSVVDKKIKTVVDDIKEERYVKDAVFISKEQGTEEMKSLLGDDFVSVFGINPVPVSCDIFLKSQYVQGLNEVDLWCFKNTTFEMDNNELILPAKMKTEMRIDGTSACIDTYAILYRYENEYMKHVNEYNGGVE